MEEILWETIETIFVDKSIQNIGKWLFLHDPNNKLYEMSYAF